MVLDPAAFTAGEGGQADAYGGDGGRAIATPSAPCEDTTATGGKGSQAKAYGGKAGKGKIDSPGGDGNALGGDGGMLQPPAATAPVVAMKAARPPLSVAKGQSLMPPKAKERLMAQRMPGAAMPKLPQLPAAKAATAINVPVALAVLVGQRPPLAAMAVKPLAQVQKTAAGVAMPMPLGVKAALAPIVNAASG
ncbi:MAG: hypothetical protein M5U34_21800 [Chloroflexi bacterium]|nr:hypothetical protein [Chloroflexota bacterium]